MSTEHTSGARVVSANNNKERARGKNIKRHHASRLKARLPKLNFLSLPSLWGRRHGELPRYEFLSLARSLLHRVNATITKGRRVLDEFKRCTNKTTRRKKYTRIYNPYLPAGKARHVSNNLPLVISQPKFLRLGVVFDDYSRRVVHDRFRRRASFVGRRLLPRVLGREQRVR